jgi:hypothetical protein
MQRGEPSVERAVPGGVVRVAAQVVTQQHLIPGRQGTGLDYVQMVRPGLGRAAAVQKPARHPGVVNPYPQQLQVTLSRADPVQITGRQVSRPRSSRGPPRALLAFSFAVLFLA